MNTEIPHPDKGVSPFFPRPFPARNTVQTGLGGIKVEIDCIARRPARAPM
jgi:hypothetical protein